MKKYIHYGHTKFDKTMFKKIRNDTSILSTKPENGCGFWASDINAKYGWKDFSEDEHIGENREEYSFKFILSNCAKVLHIRSKKDLDELPKIGNIFGVDDKLFKLVSINRIKLDFERLEKEYDAIEVHISDDVNGGCFSTNPDSLFKKLYGWDCDSILIMNPDVIIEL